MQNRIATRKPAGMQQLCVRACHWAVMEFRMRQSRLGTEVMYVTVYNGAPVVPRGSSRRQQQERPYCWSTHDKIDVGVSKSGVPQFSDFVQV